MERISSFKAFSLGAGVAFGITLTQIADADDGIAAIGAGGIVFQKSADISMDSEVLEISPDEVKVSYAFSNSSGKDVNTVVAFPVPPIICDGYKRDESKDFPDDFAAESDGKPIKFDVEAKAFIRTDPNAFAPNDTIGPPYQPGEDVTDRLKSKSLPTDCRKLEIEHIRNGNVSKAYRSVVGLGLATDAAGDPPVVYYETHIKYYWNQIFPAGKTIHITHSYHPATGIQLTNLDSYPDYSQHLGQYETFFSDHPEIAKYVQLYDWQRHHAKWGYNAKFVKFVLTTANTWNGPIGEFKLVLPPPKALVVTTLDGNISLQDGHLVVEKMNFSPTDDLTVYFIDPPSENDLK